jgi:hypothetical protein
VLLVACCVPVWRKEWSQRRKQFFRSFIAFAAFSRPLSSPAIANTGIVSRRSLRPSFCAALVGIAR